MMTSLCPAPPPTRLVARQDDASAPLSHRMRNWKIETNLRRRLEQRGLFSSTQDRGVEVGDHRALREMLPPSGGYGPGVPDPVALPAFVSRVGEWDRELRAFRGSLLQNRLKEQQHFNAQGRSPRRGVVASGGGVCDKWSDRVPEQYATMMHKAHIKRSIHTSGAEMGESDSYNGDVVPIPSSSPVLELERPLYDSTTSRARRSSNLRNRAFAAGSAAITARQGQPAIMPQEGNSKDSIVSQPSAKSTATTVASREAASRQFWYSAARTSNTAPDTSAREDAFREALLSLDSRPPKVAVPPPRPSTAHSHGSRAMINRLRGKASWYDFEGSQLAANAPHLLQPANPTPTTGSAVNTERGPTGGAAPPRIGPMTHTFPFPMF